MDDTTASTAVADAPSSPAPSAPTSSPEPTVTTDRPSLGDALSVFNEAARQQGKRPRGAKPDAIAAPSPQDAATTPPDGTVDPTQTPPATQGPIPFTVHETALKNARTKERQAVEQEFRSTVGDPAVAREAMQWFQSAARDRTGFLRDTIQEALADPELAPQVRSLLGQTLGSGRQQAAPVSAEVPQPDFTDGQGNTFYSAKQQQARDEWFANKLRTEILGEVQPDLEQVRADREAQQQERQAAQVKQTFAGYLTEARNQWDGFKEHEAEIKAALLAAPLTSGHPAEERVLLEQTYRRIVGPKLTQLQQAKWLADLKSKATASSLNPAATGAASGIPKNVRAKDGGTFGNAIRWAEQQTAGR